MTDECECGCGEKVREGRRFVHGHHNRCMTIETKRKISEAHVGRVFSEEHKKRIGEGMKKSKLGML